MPYESRYCDALLALSLRAWAPVFAELESAVPAYVYRSFYPNGWQTRQTEDIVRILEAVDQPVWLALDDNKLVGWIGVRLHVEDRMGEIHILAVDPERQRQGIANALIQWANDHVRSAGMKIMMVETGDDPGHSASRLTYERTGFERWPVARYFREL